MVRRLRQSFLLFSLPLLMLAPAHAACLPGLITRCAAPPASSTFAAADTALLRPAFARWKPAPILAASPAGQPAGQVQAAPDASSAAPGAGLDVPYGHAMPTLGRLWTGTTQLPAGMVHHWKLTSAVVLGTGALIAFADKPTDNAVAGAGYNGTFSSLSNDLLLYVTPAEVLADGWLMRRQEPFMGTVESGAITILYATAAVQAMKYAAGRERPYIGGDGDGGFFQHGNSFPSGHSFAAFTMAGFLAKRYPHDRWVAWTAYSIATTVALARVLAWKHFPSDVVFGGFMGAELGACAMTCQ